MTIEGLPFEVFEGSRVAGDLSGSTHKQRMEYLSSEIGRVNPLRDPEKFHVLFDLYLLSLDHDERERTGG